MIWDAQGQKVQEFQYDAVGNVVAETNGLGQTTHYRFNALYQRIKATNAIAQTTTFSYDVAARLTEVMEQEAAIYQQRYDHEGRLTSYTDANGNETSYRYDRTGLLLEEKNAAGGALTYRYDKRGWLEAKRNARQQETAYTYDLAGQLIEQKDKEGTIRREYDQEGRVVRVTEVGERRNEKKRVYDLAGRLLSSTDRYGHTIQYSYDACGRLSTITYPDQKEVHYTYDLAGQLTEVRDWANRITRYRYDDSGRLIRTERPNGTVEQRSYDAAGQLLRLWDTRPQGVLLQQYRYLYNEIGQIIQEEEKHYTYDRLRRLIEGKEPGRQLIYNYDTAGNITDIGDTASQDAQKMTYTKDNRLETVDGHSVHYDEDGNLLSIANGTEKYHYNSRNQLVQTGTTRYGYDAENVRTSMTWNGKTTRYVVDELEELSRVLMETDDKGKPKAYYIYGHGLIGREDAQGHYLSYHADSRGSTTILTDSQGKVTDRYTYGLYGELEKHEGTTQQPFCYNGRDGVMTDPNGLYYMRARYYHPGLKRFLNRDVLRGDIIEGQTFNRFAYVNGDPVGFIDPLGLMRCSKGAGKGKPQKHNPEKKSNIQTGNGPYSHLEDSKYVGPGKDFTAAQKKKIIEENMQKNGGVVKSDLSGQVATKPQKSKKGVTPEPNEWQIDHIIPKDKGGSNSYSNAQVLTRKENRDKSNKLPSDSNEPNKNKPPSKPTRRKK